jgi:ADP-ribose pyrophosphatase YjhB (NUDIX family)
MRDAGVMLIIKDGLILGISHRDDKTIFGLPGGKFDEAAGDQTPMDAAIRETREETSVDVKKCIQLYKRVEPARNPGGEAFECYCYYAQEWEGAPQNSEEGEVAWLTYEELATTKAAFPSYNIQTLKVFRQLFPEVQLKGV